MKKIVYTLFFLFSVCLSSLAFADSNMNDYTYVDCHNGNDTTAVPFDHSMPYNSLKAGIENSIQYINSYWNISGNANNVAYKRYVIKVKSGCVFEGYNQYGISLQNFNGSTYKNDLLITSDNDSQVYGIKNYYFDDGRSGAHNITFKNVDFLEGYSGWNGAYFNVHSQGITITNSIINVKQTGTARATFSYLWGGRRDSRYGNIIIDNSNIKIYGSSNPVQFSVPGVIRNSKIDYITTNGSIPQLQIYGHNSFQYLLYSNEFDLGGKDLYLTVDSINNKFNNVNSFNLDSNWRIFLNNTVQNSTFTNIGGWFYAYNNLFTGGFSDNTDTTNLRKNFSSNSTITGGVGWIYRRALGTYLEVNMSDKTLYNQVTGNSLGDTNSPIYLIFQ